MTRRQPRDTTSTCPECGWTGRPTTPGLAAWALQQHSCEKQRGRDAAAARGRLRKASIDRTPKPCHHKQTDHQHGTYACYVLDCCRCLPCAQANAAYEQHRVRQQAYGRWNGLIDAQPVRDHVRALQAAGLGLKRIAAKTGVPHGTLWKLIYGKPGYEPSKRVRPDTAARVLALQAVTLDDLGARRPVDPTGTRRRLQALVALGWSQAKLAGRLGMQPTNFTRVILGPGDVAAATARATKALYDELWDQAPPENAHRDRIAAARSRNRACELGWPSPLAWDDNTIDDPLAGPDLGAGPGDEVEPDDVDVVAVLRRMAGDRTVPLTAQERAEVVHRMIGQGISKRDIELRTGVNVHRVLRDAACEGEEAVSA